MNEWLAAWAKWHAFGFGRGVRSLRPLRLSLFSTGLVVKVTSPDSILQLNCQQPFTKEIHTKTRITHRSCFPTHSTHAILLFPGFSICVFLHISFSKFFSCLRVCVSSDCMFILGSSSVHTPINCPHAQASLQNSEHFGFSFVKQPAGVNSPFVQVSTRCWEMRQLSDKSYSNWK